MPICASEPAVFPDDLFEGTRGDARGEAERAWWVLHTKPRQEKRLAQELRHFRIPFYLPLMSRRSRLRGRLLVSHLPLFPGYVFLWAADEERITALTTSRVVHPLRVADQDKLWNDLRQIQHLIATGAALTPEARLQPGMAVTIESGPLAGLRGKIVRTATGRRFVVEVDFIQRGASVLLEAEVLAPRSVDENS